MRSRRRKRTPAQAARIKAKLEARRAAKAAALLFDPMRAVVAEIQEELALVARADEHRLQAKLLDKYYGAVK